MEDKVKMVIETILPKKRRRPFGQHHQPINLGSWLKCDRDPRLIQEPSDFRDFQVISFSFFLKQ